MWRLVNASTEDRHLTGKEQNLVPVVKFVFFLSYRSLHVWEIVLLSRFLRTTQVFCGKIPKEVFEDELILLFEKSGKIYDLRLMMDPMTGTNRGYAFITYTTKEEAEQAHKDVIITFAVLIFLFRLYAI